MFKKSTNNKKYIYGICILILVLFVVINLVVPNPFKIFGKVTKDSLLFFENIINKPLTNEEKKRYDEKLSDYQIKDDENKELKKEIADLKQQLELKSILSDKVTINSTVINRNMEYWYDSLTIDKGSNEGVKEGMAVLYQGYLVGRVSSTTYSNSTIRLLTSGETANKISVRININDTYIYGLLSGYKDGKYKIDGISDNVDIPLDSLVTTTGLGEFPSGITIGKVSSVTTDNFDLAKLAEVTPIVNMSNINYVTLVGKE